MRDKERATLKEYFDTYATINNKSNILKSKNISPDDFFETLKYVVTFYMEIDDFRKLVNFTLEGEKEINNLVKNNRLIERKYPLREMEIIRYENGAYMELVTFDDVFYVILYLNKDGIEKTFYHNFYEQAKAVIKKLEVKDCLNVLEVKKDENKE